MIEAGKKYRITTPVSESHIVGIGDIIEVCYVGWIGVKAIGISENSYGEPYDGILMFDGKYTQNDYWQFINECLEEVE